MVSDFQFTAADEAQMAVLGAGLGRAIQARSQAWTTIYLHGQLGMGKTTLTRHIIQSLGWAGNVKSPTYTLVETYDLPDLTACHFDLYRLADPEELEFIGIRDYQQPGRTGVSLVEWPDKGAGVLPKPDLTITLTEAPPTGRLLNLAAQSDGGETLIANLQHHLPGSRP